MRCQDWNDPLAGGARSWRAHRVDASARSLTRTHGGAEGAATVGCRACACIAPMVRTLNRRRAVAFVIALVVATACVVAIVVWRRGDDRLTVAVDGRRVSLSAPYTARHAVRAAHLHWPDDGALRSLVSGQVLDPHWSRGVVEAGGRHLKPVDVLADGLKMHLHQGTDGVEPTDRRQVPVPAPGLPTVEHELWTPGADGVADALVGTRSGEVAVQTVLQAPTAAARVPGKVVALSFDDGPDPTYTPQVLSILQQFGIKATFCVIGHAARQHPELLAAIRAQRHVLCDHTETHPYLDRVPTEQLSGQISGPVEYCRIVTGQTLRFMRPPYAALNQAAIDTAHQQGLRVLEWSVDPRDFTRPPPPDIVERVVTKVRPGGVVLMHDGGGDRSNTIAALPDIISQLQAQGYTFAQPQT